MKKRYWLAFTSSKELNEKMALQAKKEDRTVASLIRHAINHYLHDPKVLR